MLEFLDSVMYQTAATFRKFRRILAGMTDSLSNFAIAISLIGLFVFTFYFVSVTATYVAVTSGGEPNPLFKTITDYPFQLINLNAADLDGRKYSSVIGILLNTSIMLITTWYAIIPLFTYLKYRSNLKRASSFQLHEVLNDGVDDINVMNKYFNGAETITIYSGDFSFLKLNAKMREICIHLANNHRLKLVTYKSEGEINNSLGIETLGIFKSNDAIAFDSKKRIKCSYVRYRSSSVFLYKYDFHGNNGRETFVCALRETRDSRYLLDTLNALCRA